MVSIAVSHDRPERNLSDTRRMESTGAGVYELKEADERTWYRVIYLSKIDDVIYVLHCFAENEEAFRWKVFMVSFGGGLPSTEAEGG